GPVDCVEDLGPRARRQLQLHEPIEVVEELAGDTSSPEPLVEESQRVPRVFVQALVEDLDLLGGLERDDTPEEGHLGSQLDGEIIEVHGIGRRVRVALAAALETERSTHFREAALVGHGDPGSNNAAESLSRS